MAAGFPPARVSIAIMLPEASPYDPAGFQTLLRSALAQDHAPIEVIVVDGRGPAATADFLPDDVDSSRIRHVSGRFANRAAMCNAAINAASGDFLLLVLGEPGRVVLRRSGVRTMVMAATRNASLEPDRARTVGMVYADYERVDPEGRRTDVHLLDWHEGRLRDTTDLGRVFLLRTAALQDIGGFDESYRSADLYDLRLRLSERYRLAHIGSRPGGPLYSVASPPKAHNVFDYLLADKAGQEELERALTAHLRRRGAYLAPGAHVRAIKYSAEEEKQFAKCVASIVTPVNRRPEFIGQAIESVQRQTVRQVEMIVVVNGGDDDPTIAEVKRYMPGGDHYEPAAPRVRLIVLDVNNIGLCLNEGIAAARGRYYVQLDSDDRLKPDAVEKLLAVFDADPTIGMVIGSYEVWTLDERSGRVHRNEEIPVVTHEEWTAENGRNNLLRINGAGAPRAAHIKVIQELGWFGVNDTPHCRNYGEDYDLVLRISERYTIGRVWEPICEVIRHSGGTDHAIDQATIARNDNAKDDMRLQALARRRKLNRSDR